MKKSFLLFDVRQQWERDICDIDGSMPLLPEDIADFQMTTDQPIVIFCKAGVRSAAACYRLQQQGFQNVFNLKGGIDAWIQQINSHPASK